MTQARGMESVDSNLTELLSAGDQQKQITALSRLLRRAALGRDNADYFSAVCEYGLRINDNRAVRRMAYQVLRMCGHYNGDEWTKCGFILVKDLGYEDLDLRLAALRTLAFLPIPVLNEVMGGAKRHITACLTHVNPSVRLSAVQEVGVLMLDMSRPTLLFENSEADFREHLDLLKDSLFDADSGVSGAAFAEMKRLFTETEAPLLAGRQRRLALLRQQRERVMFDLKTRCRELVLRMVALPVNIQWVAVGFVATVVRNCTLEALKQRTNGALRDNDLPVYPFSEAESCFASELIESHLLSMLLSLHSPLVFEAMSAILQLVPLVPVPSSSWLLALTEAVPTLLRKHDCGLGRVDVLTIVVAVLPLLSFSQQLDLLHDVVTDVLELSVRSERRRLLLSIFMGVTRAANAVAGAASPSSASTFGDLCASVKDYFGNGFYRDEVMAALLASCLLVVQTPNCTVDVLSVVDVLRGTAVSVQWETKVVDERDGDGGSAAAVGPAASPILFLELLSQTCRHVFHASHAQEAKTRILRILEGLLTNFLSTNLTFRPAILCLIAQYLLPSPKNAAASQGPESDVGRQVLTLLRRQLLNQDHTESWVTSTVAAARLGPMLAEARPLPSPLYEVLLQALLRLGLTRPPLLPSATDVLNTLLRVHSSRLDDVVLDRIHMAIRVLAEAQAPATMASQPRLVAVQNIFFSETHSGAMPSATVLNALQDTGLTEYSLQRALIFRQHGSGSASSPSNTGSVAKAESPSTHTGAMKELAGSSDPIGLLATHVTDRARHLVTLGLRIHNRSSFILQNLRLTLSLSGRMHFTNREFTEHRIIPQLKPGASELWDVELAVSGVSLNSVSVRVSVVHVKELGHRSGPMVRAVDIYSQPYMLPIMDLCTPLRLTPSQFVVRWPTLQAQFQADTCVSATVGLHGLTAAIESQQSFASCFEHAYDGIGVFQLGCASETCFGDTLALACTGKLNKQTQRWHFRFNLRCSSSEVLAAITRSSHFPQWLSHATGHTMVLVQTETATNKLFCQMEDSSMPSPIPQRDVQRWRELRASASSKLPPTPTTLSPAPAPFATDTLFASPAPRVATSDALTDLFG